MRAALALAAAIVLVAGAAAAPPPGRPKPAHPYPGPSLGKGRVKPSFDADSVLARFRSGVNDRAALADHGARFVRAIAHTGYVVARVPAGKAQQTVAALAGDARVEHAELNWQYRADAVPNDPLYAGSQTYLAALHLEAAWDRGTGSTSAIVAIVDTGVDATHPDLAGRVAAGYDFVNLDADASDDNGHGTEVAGVAAAATDNGVGIAGAAWNATILPVKVLAADGAGYTSDIASGITWAADQGAKVINLSLGGPAPSDAISQAISYANSKDALVVAAAGNSANDVPHYPAAYPSVLSVAATDGSGSFAWFSSYGWSVDLAAPGIDVTSTALGGGYASASGTSFAAPLVSGIALLLRVQKPSLTQADVATQLEVTATDGGPRGLDPYYGFGVVDAEAALGGSFAAPIGPAPDALEPNSFPDKATPLSGTTTATIAPEGDADWYSVTVGGPTWIKWTVTPPDDSPTLRARELDPRLDAFGPDYRQLGSTDAGSLGDGETLTIRAAAAGKYYVRVANAVGAAGPAAYTITVDANAPPAVGFGGNADFHVGSWPQATAIGDVNGDGRNDALLTTHEYFDPAHDYSLYVFLQQADGTLAPPQQIQFPPYGGMGVATGDLNGDGNADVVVGSGAGVAVLYQSGGALQPPVYLNSSGSGFVEVRDVDGDGRNDVVATSGGIQLFRNTGAGFTQSAITADPADDIALGDLNGDGRVDLATIYWDVAYVYAQQADGTWSAPKSYPVAVFTDGIEIVDATGDGRNDLVATAGGNRPSSFVGVFPQLADGTLGSLRAYPSYDIPDTVAAGDMNRDGRPDLVVLHGGWLAGGEYLNEGDHLGKELLFELPYASDYYAEGLALGDLSNDGLPDVAVADYNNGLVIVHQVSGQAPPPGDPTWIRDASPGDFATGVSTSATPTVRFTQQMEPGTPETGITLWNGTTGSQVNATVSFDGISSATVHPAAALAPGTPYVVKISGTRASSGAHQPQDFSFRFVTAGTPPNDFVPPETTLTYAPPARTGDQTVVFEFVSSEPGSTFQCQLDYATYWHACTSPYKYVTQSYDVHTFRVRAIDPAGNVDPTPATWTWTWDASIPPNLVANGDFELGTSGWLATGGSLSAVSDGTVGPGAAKVARGNGKTYGIYPSSKVSPTQGGAVYTANGWVRSDTPGRTVCAVLREWTYDARSVVATTSRCVTATSSWQPLPSVSYTARSTGAQLDLVVQQSNAGRGDSFEVDGLSVVRG